MDNWIPISERLPEEEGYYLTWVRFVDREYPVTDFWHDEYGGFIDYNDYITHWMPLPEPPQEKE